MRKRLVFTTHTPELAGNEERPMKLLSDMSFFAGVPEEDIRREAAHRGRHAQLHAHRPALRPPGQRREQGARRSGQRNVGPLRGHLPHYLHHQLAERHLLARPGAGRRPQRQGRQGLAGPQARAESGPVQDSWPTRPAPCSTPTR
ncbi:MAG: hypothetical protein WKG07_28760 [Hymenobacter sp.]